MDVEAVRSNRRTWQEIAVSFDATRTRPWAPVVSFLQSLSKGARVLDAGCGNGRHVAEASKLGLNVVGLDLSRPLLEAARRRTGSGWLVEGLLERPPLREAVFDAVVVAASLHHVRARSERVRALEALRVTTRPGAALLATVWSRDQARFRKQPPREPSDPHEAGDALVGWTRGGSVTTRFVHLYAPDELRSELREAGWMVDREWQEALGGPEPDNVLARARS